MMDLLVAATTLSECLLLHSQFSMVSLLATDGFGCMCQGGQHRMFVGQVDV
jgi:hypothetical protein